MVDDTGMASRKEALERIRRRKRVQGVRPGKDAEGRKEAEKKDQVLEPGEEARTEVPGEAFRQAQRNLKYAYASATERLMRRAAAMTAGKQDDRRACSVDEALEALNHDSSATPEDMTGFAEGFMADAMEKAMEG